MSPIIRVDGTMYIVRLEKVEQDKKKNGGKKKAGSLL